MLFDLSNIGPMDKNLYAKLYNFSSWKMEKYILTDMNM